MRTRLLILTIAALVFVPLLNAQSSVPLTYVAGLTGASIPGGTGSTPGFGNATLAINGSTVTIDVVTTGLTNITGIALYVGVAGTNGSLLVTFTDPNNQFVNGRFHAVETIDSGVTGGVTINPQNFYLLVTTSSFPSGALRGQLTDANVTLMAGSISGSSPLCFGATGIAGAAGTFFFSMTPDPGGATFTIRYDVLTTGLGNSLSALEVGDALAGPGLTTIAFNAQGTDGRFTGTGQITAAKARLLQTLPSGIRFTVTTPASGINCAAAGPIQAAHEIFLPVAGSAKGFGTNYQTDVNIFNNMALGTTGTADVLMQFFPTAPTSATAQSAGWATVSARATVTYRDVSTAFDPAVTGIGAVRLVSASTFFANARIYNNLSASGLGTFGQYVAGLPRTSALSEGTLVGLQSVLSGGNLPGTPSARTNIGYFNPSDNPAIVSFEFRDGNGTILGTRTLTIPPWQQTQLPLAGGSGLFSTVNGDVTTSSVYFLSSTPIFVYASVVDNTTGDGSYVTPSTSASGGTSAGN
jgi:hypothetical protein